MQLRCGISISDLGNGGVVCVSLRVGEARGTQLQNRGGGGMGLGSLEDCKCHTHHVYRYY